MSGSTSAARLRAVLPAVVTLFWVTVAGAHELTVGDLEVGHPWARATAPTAPTGAAYFSIENHGSADDRLIAATADVADVVEIHQNTMDSAGTMQMRPVEGIDIPAGGAAALEPGGYHIMLIGLHAPLKQGASFPLTLTFEHAGTITTDVEILSIGSSGPHDAD